MKLPNFSVRRVRSSLAFLALAGIAVLGIMSGYEKVVSTFAEYGQKLHEVTERTCKEKIESFGA